MFIVQEAGTDRWALRPECALNLLSFRRIDHDPASGAWNMAVDEVLLRRCREAAEGFPCVRFYRWEPACLSLGFHQDAATAADLTALPDMGIDLVRRATGGRAVLHDRELTYSVVAPSRRGALAGPVMAGYRLISRALVEGLRRLGLAARLADGDPAAGRISAEPCFARLSSSEIEVDGFKVIGSVQLQRGGCLLQQGSVPLRLDPVRLARATGAPPLEKVRGLEDLMGRPVEPDEIASALSRGFESVFGAALRPGALSTAEEAGARRLEEARYRTSAWNLERPRRRLGEVA